MARPRGAARGSASAILSMPVLAEKRTVTGTSCLKCNALLTLAASTLGTNLLSRTTPLAWADRCVVCLPNAELSASTNVSGVVAIAGFFRVFIAASYNFSAQRPHPAGDGLPDLVRRIFLDVVAPRDLHLGQRRKPADEGQIRIVGEDRTGLCPKKQL